MHTVIGWVLSEEQPKQTCRHDRAHVLRSAQQPGRGSEFLLTCLRVDRRLICVRADSLGNAKRKDQEGEEQRWRSARNHGNASGCKDETHRSEDQRISNGFQSSSNQSGNRSEDRHRQRDETCLRAAQAWTALQPLGKSVEHTVSHQTECPVAQIGDSQWKVVYKHADIDEWIVLAQRMKDNQNPKDNKQNLQIPIRVSDIV